ncbi:hypothetical protein [Vacuolonema iberomarrocanum]|uniref:hypothetical protein n=1 Tax=Vacuolonema iberomarrocanum TaxID=3454632 RepID=UPI0019E9B409|nr:hypothetical protein [filamentous cyanobacterium LEGE 07170]
MSDDPSPIMPTSQKLTLGDRIRGLASQLRQENDVQIKATSRILGAAAQLAQNHDQLIDEVVEMVGEDLDQRVNAQPSETYTVEGLQQQFKTFKAAKAHFGIKANSWATLATKLSEPVGNPSSPFPQSQDAVVQRLEAIEQDVQAIRGDVKQILSLLTLVLKDPK